MKKLILFFVLIITLVFGFGFNQSSYSKDVVPVRPTLSNTQTVGLYQVGNDIKIYKEPNEDSQILYRVRWNEDDFFPDSIGAEKFFVVFMPAKELALVSVTDITDDWDQDRFFFLSQLLMPLPRSPQ